MSEKYQLVLRKCKCGCGKTWRCSPTSANKYFSDMHARYHNSSQDVSWCRDEAPRMNAEGMVFRRVTELVEMGLAVTGIRARLNEEGYRTVTGKMFTMSVVYMIMLRLGLRSKLPPQRKKPRLALT